MLLAVTMVVKLGGSYAHGQNRAAWLAAIGASHGVVVVPGGGPFADAVRTEQPRLGYDDRAAHDMALMAMAQYGTALAAPPRLRPADSLAEITATAAAGAVPIWRPWPMLRDEPSITPGWDVTSDSLAVWLATRLGADRVLLLKQTTQADDLVDHAFPAYRAAFAGQIWVAGPDDAPGRLDPERPPGRLLS